MNLDYAERNDHEDDYQWWHYQNEQLEKQEREADEHKEYE